MSAVTRLAVEFVAPEKAMTPGSSASCVGPYSFHVWPLPPGSPVLASLPAIFAKVASACAATLGGITSAGYVRAAERYASKPPSGPSPMTVPLLLTRASGSPPLNFETWRSELRAENAPASTAVAASTTRAPTIAMILCFLPRISPPISTHHPASRRPRAVPRRRVLGATLDLWRASPAAADSPLTQPVLELMDAYIPPAIRRQAAAAAAGSLSRRPGT